MDENIYAITEEALDDYGSEDSLTALEVTKDKKKQKEKEDK